MIRDDASKINLLGAKWCEYTSVLVADALALKEGIRAARFLGINYLKIEGDNLCLINSIKANWKIHGKLLSLLMTLKGICFNLLIIKLTISIEKLIK